MGTASKKVLIVDDEEILTWIMSKTLSKDKDIYEIILANDGEKALKIMKDMPIDLVISDIRMPGLSGLDILEEIGKKYHHTQVVIMTAYGNPDVQKEATEGGCLHYLEKPFKIEELRGLILDAVKETKKGFVGKVADLQITDIIQLNCLGRTTTAISVKKSDQEGVIYFKEGEIVHSEVDDTIGEEALFIILSWEGGDFTTLTGAEPIKESISSNWQELLMEGMRRKDEGQKDEGRKEEPTGLADLGGVEISPKGQDLKEFHKQEVTEESFDSPEIDFETDRPKSEPIQQMNAARIPGGSSKRVASPLPRLIPKEDVSPPKKKELSAAKTTSDRKALLKQIIMNWEKSSDEIEGGAVVTIEGLPFAYYLPNRSDMDARRFGTIVAAFFKAGEKSASGIKTGKIQELQIVAMGGSLHIYPVGKTVLLAAIGKKDCNIGMVHVESIEACKKILSIIKTR